MNEQTKQPRSVREAWDIAVRYRWRLVVPMFLTILGVLGVGMLLPRKYQAEAIFERRTDMVLAEITTRGASQGFQSPRASTTEELSGQPAIDSLIETLKPKLRADPARWRLLNNLGDLRSDINKRLVVRYDLASNELDRMHVSYTSGDPELARMVVNTLVESYIDRTQSSIEKRLNQSAAFFEEEANRERKLIEAQENKMLTFEIAHSDLLPDNPSNLSTVLTQTQLDLSDLDQKRQAAVLKEAALRRTLAATPATIPSVTTSTNPEMTRLQGKIRELENELNVDVGVYKMTDRHPDLVALRDQITKLKAQMARTEDEVVTQRQYATNPRRAEVEMLVSNAAADRESLEGQCKAMRERVSKLNVQAQGMFPVRSDYRKISRDTEQHQRQLAFWEDNLRRVRMASAAENGDRGVKLDFIKPCAPIDKPISPDLTQLLIIALALGLLVGGVNVFVAHRTDESFSSGEELAKAVGLPLFGSVSELVSANERSVRRVRQMVLYPVHVAAMAAILLFATALLYMSLERPQEFDAFKQHPTRFVMDHLKWINMSPATAQASRK